MTTIADTSETGIANEALSLAETRSTLSSLNQPNSKAARVCRLHFGSTRDEILRTYSFAFSHANEAMPEVLPKPTGSIFTAALAWPVDCLRVLTIEGVRKRQWRPEAGHRILVAGAAPLNVHFVRREPDFTLWDPLAKQLMVVKLAMKIAPEITHLQRIGEKLGLEWERLDKLAPKLDAYEADSVEDDLDYDAWVPEYIAVRM